MKELIGRVITEIWVAPGEHSIHFKTDDGWMAYYAEGDCCSESWFADIILPPRRYWETNLWGERVSSVMELELPDDGQERSRQDRDLVYGIGIATESGTCTIAFRNSSNGYYGGSLSRMHREEPPKGSKKIVEDWGA